MLEVENNELAFSSLYMQNNNIVCGNYQPTQFTTWLRHLFIMFENNSGSLMRDHRLLPV